jgi:lipoprotein-releasing system ATP-binding protein
MPVIVAQSVSKSYAGPDDELIVLRNVDIEVEPGGSAALMGPSGSGKSTLLNILGTLEPPSSGEVRISGENPYQLGERDLARFRNQRIGFVFQEHHLLPQCTLLENVFMPALAWGRSAEESKQLEARSRELLERVGLTSRIHHRPGELSGGERQRAALARALVCGPSVILADEPTGNLDRANAEIVADLLLALCRLNRAALIVATHSAALADRFDVQFELADGSLLRS